MKYINKYFLLGALLLAAQSALAGSISDTYAPGDTLTATQMGNIKSAVNDNNTKVTNNTGAINTNTSKISANSTSIGSLGGRVTTLEAKRPGPIAFGAVRAGVLYANSGNVSVVWNATSSRYEVTITGESYFINSYVTSVTPIASSAVSCATNSVSGLLIIFCYDSAGTSIQSDLGFVVYKP